MMESRLRESEHKVVEGGRKTRNLHANSDDHNDDHETHTSGTANSEPFPVEGGVGRRGGGWGRECTLGNRVCHGIHRHQTAHAMQEESDGAMKVKERHNTYSWNLAKGHMTVQPGMAKVWLAVNMEEGTPWW